MDARCFTFVAGAAGPWRIIRRIIGNEPVVGQRRCACPGWTFKTPIWRGGPQAQGWHLRSVTSHQRYTHPRRATAWRLFQTPWGGRRPCAALIPITKTLAWWAMTQDERRAILEERSAHIAIGMRYLPAIAHKLHH